MLPEAWPQALPREEPAQKKQPLVHNMREAGARGDKGAEGAGVSAAPTNPYGYQPSDVNTRSQPLMRIQASSIRA